MAHTYSIHMVLPFSINGKRIPNHASTHYIFTVYQTKDITPKTQKGFAHKPKIQRKFAKTTRPLAVAQPVAKTVATAKPKKQRSKFRKDINKRALAAYFDNDVKQSRADAIKKWQDVVVAELEAADKIAAQNAYNLQADIEHRYNVLGVNNIDISVFSMISQTEFDALKDAMDTDPESGIWDEYDIDPNYDLYFDEFDNPEFINRPNKKAELDSKERAEINEFTVDHYPHRHYSDSTDKYEKERAEINESIVDHFTQKYNGADTNAAMRAYEKQKFHGTGMQYILHKLQITK